MELFEIYSSEENEKLIMILTAIVVEKYGIEDGIKVAENIYKAVKQQSHEVNE